MPRGRVRLYVGDIVVVQAYSGLKIDGKHVVRKLLGGGTCLIQRLGTGLLWYVGREQLHKLAATQLARPQMYFPGHDRCTQCGRDYVKMTQAQIDGRCLDCTFSTPEDIPVSSVRVFRTRNYKAGRLITHVSSNIPVQNLDCL